MNKSTGTGSAKVFISGVSQAVRLPKKFRFDEGCSEVAVRRVGRHLILSPRFSDWDDYFENSIPVRLVSIDIQKALEIALEHNIYAYDAYFLQCAQYLSCPLITLDKQMKKIALKLNISVME